MIRNRFDENSKLLRQKYLFFARTLRNVSPPRPPSRSVSKDGMDHDRRVLLTTVGAAVAAGQFSVLGSACAGANPSSQPKGGPAHKKVNRHDALRAAVTECINAGDACLAHCLEALGAGDTSLAACARSVHDMLAICRATGPLAAVDSKFLPGIAALCAASCDACEVECKPHISHHAECKACMEACIKVSMLAKKVAA